MVATVSIYREWLMTACPMETLFPMSYWVSIACPVITTAVNLCVVKRTQPLSVSVYREYYMYNIVLLTVWI